MVSAHDNPEERALTREERQQLRTLLIGERACNALKFQTVAVRYLGPAAGIFARQLLFWDGRGMDPEGWIYKSINDWKHETGLSRRQQEKARRILIGKGLMQEKLALGPDRRRRLFFLLDLEALIELLGKDLLPPPTPDPDDIEDELHEDDYDEDDFDQEVPQVYADRRAEQSLTQGSNMLGIREQCSVPTDSGHGPLFDDSEQGLAPGISGLAVQKRTAKEHGTTGTQKSSPAGGADASPSRPAPPTDEAMKVQEGVALAVSLLEERGYEMERAEREILGRNLAALGLQNLSRERATLAVEQCVEEAASSPQQAILTSPERANLLELLEDPKSRTGSLAGAYRATEGLYASPIGIQHIATVAKLELGLEGLTADELIPTIARLLSRVRHHIGPLATSHSFTATGEDGTSYDREQSAEVSS